MQADFNLSYAQLGLLPALYMAGLMVSCLVFNELTNHVNSFRLVGEARGTLPEERAMASVAQQQ